MLRRHDPRQGAAVSAEGVPSPLPVRRRRFAAVPFPRGYSRTTLWRLRRWIDLPGTRAGAYSLTASGDRPGRNENAVIGGDYATRRRETRTRLGDGDPERGRSVHPRPAARQHRRKASPSGNPAAVRSSSRNPGALRWRWAKSSAIASFGEGVVQEVQGEGETEQATVNFPGEVGLKRLLVSLAGFGTRVALFRRTLPLSLLSGLVSGHASSRARVVLSAITRIASKSSITKIGMI